MHGEVIQEVEVETSNGKLIGLRNYYSNVISYLGVPYAEPPVGKYRFRPSKPKRPWYPSSYKAFNYSAECLQSPSFSSEEILRDEDCLYINIWQPSSPKSLELLPVLVWIYGGGFLHGSASRPEYSGHVMASRGVVVVSLNYRVGALGFLVSIPDQLFGNYGLHDQKLALQWIQDNIHIFNGDPNRITVFGESAGKITHILPILVFNYVITLTGGMSAALHLLDHQLSKFSRPLFKSVILQSNPLGYKYRSLTVANFLGTEYKNLLDCEDVRCLQSESPDELIHVQETLMAVPRSIGDFFNWGPVLTDSQYYREVRLRRGSPISNMTVRQPIEAMKTLKKLDFPLILGTTSHEGIVFVYTAFPTRMMFKFIFQAIVFSFFREAAPRVMKLYSSLTKRVDKSDSPDYRIVLSRIIGDYLFKCPNILFANQAAKLNNPVFLYEFSLQTRTPGFACCDGLACHTCELPYVFEHINMIQKDYSWIEKEVAPSLNKNIIKNETKDDSLFNIDLDLMFNSFDKLKELLGYSRDKRQQRLKLDVNVARLMASYWTTFASYSNPNGLIDINAVVSGTRPKNAPWWPQLFGELPSEKAGTEMNKDSIQRSKNILNLKSFANSVNKNSELNSENVEITSPESIYLELLWDETYRNDDLQSVSAKNSKNKYSNKHKGDNIYNSVLTDGELASGMFYDDKFSNVFDDSSTDDRLSEDFYFNQESKSVNNLKSDSKSMKSSKDTKTKLITDTINKKSKNNQYIHIMNFDELPGVHILEKEDCVCEAWNKLNYKF